MTVCVQGFNISQVEDIVKDVFSKQDKTRAVDIFQVMISRKLAQKKILFFGDFIQENNIYRQVKKKFVEVVGKDFFLRGGETLILSLFLNNS